MFPAKRTYDKYFRQDTTKKGLIRGDFLFVRRKHHARARSVFLDQAMVLEDSSHVRYRWSYLAEQVLHLKLH